MKLDKVFYLGSLFLAAMSLAGAGPRERPSLHLRALCAGTNQYCYQNFAVYSTNPCPCPIPGEPEDFCWYRIPPPGQTVLALGPQCSGCPTTCADGDNGLQCSPDGHIWHCVGATCSGGPPINWWGTAPDGLKNCRVTDKEGCTDKKLCSGGGGSTCG
jgi:hypothetical protein